MNNTGNQPRLMGPINFLGLWTLMRKETERFVIVSSQTIVAPVVTTLLYYVVFSLAFGGAQRHIGDIPFMTFLAPGLIMMSIAQNAFANTSSSIVISKVQGNIVDVLMAPLSIYEWAAGYTLGGIARGLAVGFFGILTLMLLTPLPIHHIGFIAAHALMGSSMMALLGIIGGIWAVKFDHLAAVTNFVIMPATFLSGTFYTADRLPKFWAFLCHLNPFFYMIDGFRYGFIGVADSPLGLGLAVMAGTNLVLAALCLFMLHSGYRLKS
ncbi:MAG TPA: ABC transporter permease [Alphaproteobacteria bacterium]|nr:ABC transporter permease [Alphaproteobacteria bacterium]